MFGIDSPLPVAALALALPLCAQNGHPGPPGLLRIEGGRTEIGSDVDEVEPLILDNETIAGALMGETPRHRVELPDYYLMPTEVTNEQYAAFVKATGGKPAYTWADPKAVDDARRAFLEAEGLKAKQAREAGQRYDRKKFDDQDWWEKNWEGTPWNVPKDELTKPVVYVSYAEAQAYARWAGLRLMTEYEYEYAASGGSDQPYPWGTEWNKDACANRDLGIDATQPVASHPAGARNGFYDLVGNVWEWTSSPYDPYPKYETKRFKEKGRGKREFTASARFDPDERVSRGGCFSNGAEICQVTRRRGTSRKEATNALGLRCAASTTPGLDVVNAMMGKEINLRVLPPDTEFFLDQPVVLRRWESEDGSVKVDGYQVITGYQDIVFCPVKAIDAPNANTLNKTTETDGPVLVGFFSTAVPIVEPPLPAGTYYVTYRGPAKIDEAREAAAVDVEPDEGGPSFEDFATAPGFDAEAHMYVVHDEKGAPVATIRAPGEPQHDKVKSGGSFSVVPYVPPSEEELEKLAKEGKQPPPARDTLKLEAVVFDKTGRKAFTFVVPFLVTPNSIDASWMR